MKKTELIEHTADIGIKVYGKTLAELFSNAAAGMFSLITDPEKVGSGEKFKVNIKGRTREDLLVNWLGELLYRFSVEKIIPSEYNISQVNDTRLKADVFGEKYDKKKHILEREVKAATYYQLKIEEKPDWNARIIFDI